MKLPSADDILFYWFGALEGPESFPQDRNLLWWGEDSSTDYFLRQAYEPALTAARKGALDAWRSEARPSLALLILMDRMSRQIYRGLDCAFENDLVCQILSLEGVEAGLDRELLPVERVFYYSPLSHAEDLEVQDRGMELLAGLRDEGPQSLRGKLEGAFEAAVQRRDVIARFGRFPERNQQLSRLSTPDEVAYLRRSRSPRRGA